jgi:transketolase
MRKTFATLLHEEMKANKDIYLLTGDLGFKLWDNIKNDFPNNYINPGSAEQLLIGMATGLALEGKIPVVYSITPFLIYRPFEIIRNYMHYEKIPVKLIGGGRGRDYGVLGYTHWAEEDEKIIDILNNIKQYRPEKNEDVNSSFKDFLYSKQPCYMNLKK